MQELHPKIIIILVVVYFLFCLLSEVLYTSQTLITEVSVGLAAVMWGSFFDKVHKPYFNMNLHSPELIPNVTCKEPAPCSVFIFAAMDWCRSCVSCGDPVGCNGVCGDPVGCNGVCGLQHQLPIVQNCSAESKSIYEEAQQL